MPEIPEGAAKPQDHQSAAVKPREYPNGWELLRNTVDLEFWEVTDFLAATAKMKQRGNSVELTAANLGAVGQIVKQMQEVFAVDSAEFKKWLRDLGDFEAQATAVIPLAVEYAAALGEAVGSAS
jgi:hypothetical protein